MPDPLTLPGTSVTVSDTAPTTPTVPVDVPSNLQPPSSGNVLASTQPAPASPPASAPQQQPPQPRVNPAAAKQIVHHALLGKLAHSLFNDEDINYSVDPKTGQTVVTRTPQKPGALFKRLVAGAILGGAAASAHPNQGGFLGGFATGGQAEQENLQAEDLRKREQAQKQFENQQSVDRAEQEKLLRQAQIAQYHATTLEAEMNLNLRGPEFIGAYNERNNMLKVKLDEMGAKPYPILYQGKDINGQVDNGGKLMAHGTADMNNLKPPAGYHSLPIVTVDYSGLSLKGGKWVDEKGNPAELSDRTTITMYALPDSVWNERTKMKGAEINKLFGGKLAPDDEKNYDLSWGDITALTDKGNKGALEKDKGNLELATARWRAAEAVASAKKADSEAKKANKEVDNETRKGWLSVYEESRTIISDKRKAIAEKKANFEDTATEEKELAEYENDVKTIRKQLYPNTVVTPGAPNPEPNPKNGQPAPNLAAPAGKALVYDPQNAPHFVDSDKVKAFLSDPQYKGWHQ